MTADANREIHPDVMPQLAPLLFAADRPLIVTDADEVLFHFMAGFESWLTDNGFTFDWASFALAGNVREKASGAPVAQERLGALLLDFFASATETMAPVEHAAPVLAGLSQRAQILVLSNLPLAQAEDRRRALVRHGMDYPLVANIGSKGAVLRHLAETVTAPIIFIDDIPRNHASVRRELPRAINIHYVANRRLAAMMARAPDCDHWADSWLEIEDIAARAMDGAAA